MALVSFILTLIIHARYGLGDILGDIWRFLSQGFSSKIFHCKMLFQAYLVAQTQDVQNEPKEN